MSSLKLLNLLQLSEAFALSIFVSNLKPDIAKFVRLFQPKNLTHALHLAKQMETIIYNPSRKPFLPYIKPIYSYSSYPNLQTPFKSHQFLIAKPLPGLLPTPKTLMLPYTNQNLLTLPILNQLIPDLNPPITNYQEVSLGRKGKIGGRRDCVCGVD